MRLVHVVPLLALVGVGVLAAVALQPAERYEFQYDTLPSDELPGPAAIAAGIELRGQLLGAEGAPIEGASLLVVQGGRPLWTFSDERGEFRLGELVAGPLDVAVNHPDYAATVLQTQAGGGPVRLEIPERKASPPRLPELELVELTGSVSVPGVDDLSGFELSLVPVERADSIGGGVPRRVRTSPAGGFVVPELAAAEYEVRLLPPEAAGGSWPDLLTELDGPPLLYSHPPEDQPGRALELQAICGAIAGAARDAETGAALEGALVQVAPTSLGDDVPPDPRRFPAVQTNARGAYRIPLLPPGHYWMTLTAGSDRRERNVIVPARSTVDPGL